MTESLRTLYENNCRRKSDINEHLSTLFKYAKESSSVAEFGVRGGDSTSALLYGLTQSSNNKNLQYVGVDIAHCPIVHTYSSMCKDLDITYTFIQGDSATTDLGMNVDTLFIDSWHIYGHLKRELAMHHSHVQKYIIMHDTTVDEWAGESVRNLYAGWNIENQAKTSGYPMHEVCAGVWPAIHEFLQQHPEWVLKERFTNNNGLTVLERRSGVTEYKILANNRFWWPIAKALQEALDDNGVATEVVQTVDENSDDTYIVFCMHELNVKLPKNFIGYNFEQLDTSNSIAKVDIFWERAKKAKKLWDYSQLNMSLYEQRGLAATFVPLGYAECMRSNNPAPSRKVQCVFTGVVNDRRKQVLDALETNILETRFVNDVFGEATNDLYSLSQVGVNVHYYEGNTILEVTRILPMLANGVHVVTERSKDEFYDTLLAPIVTFVDSMDDMVECVKQELSKSNSSEKHLEYLQTTCSYASFIKFSGVLSRG